MVLVIVSMLSFEFGCGRDPYAGHYARTKPNQQWFIGHWMLRAGSPGANQATPTKLEFSADGSFQAVNYPAIALGSFGAGKSFLDGTGTWSVEPHQSFWVIGIHWKNLGSNQVDYGQMLHVLYDRPPQILHHIIGDPDSGEALVFERAK
jgi:hypothetical protein